MVEEIPPKVFISYSWTDDAHVAWVEQLATRLMNDGVDVIFDQWDLKQGHDLYVFMEQMVSDPEVKKVLAICDAKYAAKADGREGGVGTESQIISPEIYEKTRQEKFIALVRELDNDGSPCLPVIFKARMYFDFSDDTQFEESYDNLLRDIHDAPAKRRPQIGRRPSHLSNESPTTVRTTSTFLRLKDCVEKQKSFVPAVLDEFYDLFLESMNGFRISMTNENHSTFDDMVVASIEGFRPYRDEFVACHFFMQKYVPTIATDDSLISFLERLASFQFRPQSVTRWSESEFDNFCIIAYELFLYTVAGCIRAKRYDTAAALISHQYHIPNFHGRGEFGVDGADVFNNYARSIEEFRKARLKQNWISMTGELIKSRAPCGPIGFSEIIQADFLLFIRKHFPNGGPRWYPRCLPYSSLDGSLELFSKAATDAGIAPLAKILGVTTREQLVDGLENLLEAKQLDMQWHAGYSLTQLTNYNELCRRIGRIRE